MSEPLGQIRSDSAFGRALTALATESEVIVEIGTWRGEGSTRCLANGLVRPTQRMWSLELCKAQHEEAKARYDDPRITFLWGTLVLPHEVPPFEYPDPDFRQYYDKEVEINRAVPYLLEQMPEAIDLLLIDGGSWSGGVEFRKLGPRSKVIALDDTNPMREIKCVAIRRELIDAEWIVLHDQLEDRNGWAIFKRP